MILYGNVHVAQPSEQVPVTSEVVGSILTSTANTHARSWSLVGLFRVHRFANVDRVVGIVKYQ